VTELIVEDYDGWFLGTLRSQDWRESIPAIEAALQDLAEEIHPKVSPKFFWVENFPGKKASPLSPGEAKKTIREENYDLEIRLGLGLHSGLFLDQRDNRRRLKSLAAKKKVLNLFCYTGSFTLAAFAGGASEVHSVDLSKNYLQWLQLNLKLNAWEKKKSVLHSNDVFEYLKKSRSKKESYDLIVLDPPTFSRSGPRNFSTEKHWSRLLEGSLELLDSKGQMLASLNTQRFSAKEFFSLTQAAARAMGRKILEKPSLPVDIGLDGEEAKNPYLKSCWIG